MPPPQTKADYQIGIICALALEQAAMIAMLDETHPELPKDIADPNVYTLGRIGIHNVVIACLPAGSMGNGPAAIVASNMQRSFSTKFGLMVGIGGGVWSKKNDIRLGDIVVSQPTDGHGGVIQWDYGKTESEGKFRCTGHLSKPPSVLRHALQALKTFDITDGINISEALEMMKKKKPHMAKTYKYHGADYDQLFQGTYDHKGGDTCDDCDTALTEERPRREESTPEVHYGNIASGNQVMKHGITRDRIAKNESVICFEMEAAGLMDDFPCLVIRGICDYADSHKNKRWQPYAAATAAAFARILLSFVNKQDVINTPKPLRVLPFGRNKDFVGRQSYLNALFNIFYLNNTEENCQRAALNGLGGVGKTQIALEFAFQLQEKSPGHSVFWAQASDATTFENSYRKIGRELDIPGLDDNNVDVKELVKSKLSDKSTGKWLLIVDNADNLELFYNNSREGTTPSLSDYLPFSFSGGILFTTRDRKAGTWFAQNFSNRIEVTGMNDFESSQLLNANLGEEEVLISTVHTSKLLELLANLPLAIVQAAAYINQSSTTVSQYLKIYEEKSDNIIALLSKDFNDERRYCEAINPISKTWLISFDQIRHRDPLAAEYLAFIACIKDQDIPEDLLPDADLMLKTEAIGTLIGFAFLKAQIGGRLYNMHRLVHLATRNWLENESQLSTWTGIVLQRLVTVIPPGGHKGREKWTAYLLHGVQVAESTYLPEGMGMERINLLDRIGRCQLSIGQYKAAENTHRAVLELCEKLAGKEHPETLARINEVGVTLSYQGKCAEAEVIYRETLALEEKVLGREHPDTLISMGNLALALSSRGKYTEAETMHQEALALIEKVLGKENPRH